MTRRWLIAEDKNRIYNIHMIYKIQIDGHQDLGPGYRISNRPPHHAAQYRPWCPTSYIVQT